ncbi:hypothetical protein Glove_19g371 [Diversispora epigaea]|uniref:Uncharacterized protein n=1 Tax=Diversispora epigaea TaxID=1348612 RepID=A0A397JKP1_9GLOM|nr:hypothetical protein Glove_19g371 [Diversispora epigaea]
MKLIEEKKIFSISKLWKRSSPTVHSKDSQTQQPVLLATATSNPTPPPPSKNLLLRHLNITKFKIDCAKHFKNENQVVHYCTKYLVNFPNSYNTMCNRAEAYGKLKKYDEAINDLDAAILLRPQRSTAWCLRGVVKGLKKSYTDTLDDLNKAIVIDPIDCLALKWRAFCYYNLKSYEQALSDLNIIINLGCSDEFTYINRANIYRELKNPGESYKDAASGSSIKLASITVTAPEIELSSFGNLEVDNNINALPGINDVGDKSIINKITSTQEEPSTSTKQVSITGTTSKAKLSGFDNSEVDININSLSNDNDSKEKNIINENNSIQKEPSINSESIDTTSKTALLSLSNLEVDNNINVLSNINNTEKKNENVNSTSNKTVSITDTTFKPLFSAEVDSKINALSNIINNFKSTQKEPTCEDERKNEINKIFDEIFNCVEKMKKYQEQQEEKRNKVNESNYYYSRGWKSEKKYH